MRLRAQEEAGTPAVSRRAEPAAPATPEGEVSFDRFSLMFPDLVSRSRSAVTDG